MSQTIKNVLRVVCSNSTLHSLNDSKTSYRFSAEGRLRPAISQRCAWLGGKQFKEKRNQTKNVFSKLRLHPTFLLYVKESFNLLFK